VTNECARCGRELADGAYVCDRPCTRALHRSLLLLASLAESAVDTIARQTRHGDGGPGGRTQPLPVDLAASDRAVEVERTVVERARWIAEQRGLTIVTADPGSRAPNLAASECEPAWMLRLAPHLAPVDWGGPLDVPDRPAEPGPPVTLAAPSTASIAAPILAPAAARAATWLTGQLDWLRHRAEAADVYRELHAAVSQMRWIVEGPIPRWYAGQCWELVDGERCTTDLYANPGADTVRCSTCGYRHDTDYRRKWLLDEARDTLAHAELLARAVTALGRPVKSAQIRDRAHRGRLVSHGYDPAGRPLYRIGDLLDLLDEAERLEAARASARAVKRARKEAEAA
jgi:hypothetical protein